MDRESFKAARQASGMSQTTFGAALGVSRETVAKIEGGKIGVSDAVAKSLATMNAEGIQTERVTPAKPARPAAPISTAPDARRTMSPYDFASAPDFVQGLARLPASNLVFGPGMSELDKRPAGEGWQRIPGCAVICTATIPQPLPFRAPAWAAPRGIITASGRVFDQITGRELFQIGTAPPARYDRQTMGRATPKAPPKARARR